MGELLVFPNATIQEDYDAETQGKPLKHLVLSPARRFAVAAGLSVLATLAIPGSEGAKPLQAVKIGSKTPSIMDELKANGGATLRGGPDTRSAPVGIADTGTIFEAEGVFEGTIGSGKWVKVKLHLNDPGIDINYDILGGQIPSEVFVNRRLVKRISPDRIHPNNDSS
ncbi:MAG: hypothetical protein HY426_01110 [Candidatus Levybacteria bacterium]|nr:hypothetical protein [Candidatus Levybacteria bacterium]